MRVFNRVDEKGRFLGLKFDFCHEDGDGQFDSHSSSYIGSRKLYQEMGYEMCFDLKYGKESVLVEEAT